MRRNHICGCLRDLNLFTPLLLVGGASPLEHLKRVIIRLGRLTHRHHHPRLQLLSLIHHSRLRQRLIKLHRAEWLLLG